MRLGIDVGGTNTDAVLLQGKRPVSWFKTPTTRDVTGGITTALNQVLAQSQTEPARVNAVMIGTTHFTNAVVERRRLMQTACIRLGLPATQSLPPMVDWPPDLRETLGNHWYLAHGGHEYDGRPISAFDENEIRGIARQIRELGIRSVAISAVFSPVDQSHERVAAALVAAEIPGAAVSLSSEIGRIGLLERENAAIMNACLRDLAGEIVSAFRQSLSALGIKAPFYISQNDGTLMSAAHAEKYPVFTFASGPTNSMRGAAFLSGVKDAMVVDVGGTTTDVGMLVNGFPREASLAVAVGGVRTNFRMPDVYSFGLGGGSLVRRDPLSVGPQSVGYELTSKALIFGGDVLTASDIAVAAGVADFGERSRVRHLDGGFVQAARERMQAMVAEAIDRMKTSAAPVPVVLVGGGSVLVQDALPGASDVIRPDHFAVANAIGAAIAQVGGETDRVFSLEKLTREQALAQAKQDALDKTLAAGAMPHSVEIVEVDEVPLAYLPSNAIRMHVKAVGDLPLEE
ncbi:MAG: hydantoinase/oxoprolinase family protein [Chloroflexi bacterium]|nr:MAG: hydantoinase/oxoprolinase family protein [Chloroflexota bacterium]